MRVREVFGFATNFSIMCITFFKLYTVPGYFFREGHTCAGFVYTYTNIPILTFMLEKRNVFAPVNAPTPKHSCQKGMKTVSVEYIITAINSLPYHHPRERRAEKEVA